MCLIVLGKQHFIVNLSFALRLTILDTQKETKNLEEVIIIIPFPPQGFAVQHVLFVWFA